MLKERRKQTLKERREKRTNCDTDINRITLGKTNRKNK